MVTTDFSAVSASDTSSAILKNTTTLKIYPNPAQNVAAIAFAASGNYTIQLSDVIGKVIKTIKGIAIVGENKLTIDLSRLSKGLYFVTLLNGNNKKQVAVLSKQ